MKTQPYIFHKIIERIDLILDDVISGNPHDSKIVSRFNEFMCSTDMYDVWRLYNGNTREFTWSSSSAPWKARRLDYLLVNDSMFDKVTECDIIPVSNTDHRAVTMTMSIGKIKRGPGYWKFNQSLLKDQDYVKIITNKITNCKLALESFPAQVKWDYCKSNIKECSIIYSKEKALQRKNAMADIRNKLKSLQSLISNYDKERINTPKEELINEMKDTKLSLDIFSLYEAQGAQTRARMKWIENGERNNKYFLGLEKSNYNKKIILSLKDENGLICTKQNEIMDIQVKLYKNLYKEKFQFEDKKHSLINFCEQLNIPQLSTEQQTSCEGQVSSEEAGYALSTMKNDSAPGTDGLTASFYKFFWKDIKELVTESFNEAFNSGSLSVSQRRAIITLIHKGKDLPKDQLGNWRPISLTNVDYKILAKSLALRLQNVIKSVVLDDQVGYIKGRNISTGIRLIDDVIEYIQVNNKTGAVVALDYTKAFDSIHKKFLIAMFELSGFGPEFTQWVKVLMNDTESCISYCGWLSAFFPVNSGIRQGCPFSPLAFVLAVELLAHKIRQSPDVKGICIPTAYGDTFIKLTMYADDTTLLLRDKNDVQQALKIVEDFSMFSGLLLNRSKTEAMSIGKDISGDSVDIRWIKKDDYLKILGVYFNSTERISNIDKNWNEKLEAIIRLIKSWEKRNLSIIGKIHIIKTFLLSQLTYIMQSLVLPDDVLKKLNTILFKFIWKKKYSNRRAFEKIRRDVLCGDYENGGLKMINAFDMQNAFIIKWVKNVYCNKWASYSCIPVMYYEKLGYDFSVLRSSVRSKHFTGFNEIRSQYWKKALEVWLNLKVVKNEDTPNADEVDDIAMQPLWNNVLVQYKGKSLFYKGWVESGYICVGDLFIDECLVTLDHIVRGVGPDARLPLQYYALYNAVPAAWRDPAALGDMDPVEPMFRGTRLSSLTTGMIRQLLVKDRVSVPCCVNFWKRKFPEIDINKDTFIRACLATKETRLRVLQWKIIHNIYPTNILLYKMGVSNSSNCSCGERDYIEHFFCTCAKTMPLWEAVKLKISAKFGIDLDLTILHKMFGVSEELLPKYMVKDINHLIVVAKMCISKFVYGDYGNLVNLLENELKIRKIFQTW